MFCIIDDYLHTASGMGGKVNRVGMIDFCVQSISRIVRLFQVILCICSPPGVAIGGEGGDFAPGLFCFHQCFLSKSCEIFIGHPFCKGCGDTKHGANHTLYSYASNGSPKSTFRKVVEVTHGLEELIQLFFCLKRPIIGDWTTCNVS